MFSQQASIFIKTSPCFLATQELQVLLLLTSFSLGMSYFSKEPWLSLVEILMP